MNKVSKFFVMVAFLLQISGCNYYIVSFEDVSNKAPYSAVVNSTFKTKAELVMYGYNLNSTPGKEIHEYAITSPPGPSNRYVLSRKKIDSGTSVKVVAVKRCTDCFLDFKPRIKLEVTSKEIIREHDVPMLVDDNLLVNSWGNDGKATQFNNEYLMRVE